MFDACRPARRLFYLLVVLTMVAAGAWAATPATTTVSDVVYRADGTPARGTVLISWPTFNTADGKAVAAGNKSVVLTAQGLLSVDLAPNAGGSPANTVYTVVFQLDDGVRTEFWTVPTNSPTTITAVRTALGATTQAGQFATRQYVDAAVSNVGSGSYVSKAGDTMSGPLMLNSDPTAPNHATTRHYVDTGLAAKANVVGGVVPANQLGSGPSDGTMCLKGDSSWGACGTSSNAVSIQSVPVDSGAPADGQVITYEATSGKYKPKPGSGITAGMAAVKYAPDFNWTQSPAADLNAAGAKTVNLTACAPGVRASETDYYVYVAGTGTAEAVKVTGGTCNGDGLPGTLQFMTVNAHPAGYTVASASGGLQEALVAARITPSNPTGSPQAGRVIVPPGEFKAYARVSIRASNVTVDFSGSIIECYMNDTCLFAGDPASANTFQDITLVNPRGRPMVVGGQKPFIEVNATKTRLFNVATRMAATGATFGTYVQVDDDQAFLLDGLDTTLGGGSGNYGVRCDATVCNPVIYAPGPFNTYSAVGWLKNLNISLQCKGNGVDWQSGNTVRISDSVIQGYAQYGVRAGTKRGGYGGFELSNVYEEVGSCTNPAGAIGEAGVIAQGGTVKIVGGEGPTGYVPQFANTGSTDYRYYVVARHATYGASNPLYAGKALTSGTGSITVTVPDIAGANTLDLLRVPGPTGGNREAAPYGTGNFAVATNVARATACSGGVCTFTDTQAALQSYSVAAPTYFPLLDFWPGNLVLGANADTNSALAGATAIVDTVQPSTVAVQGTLAPAIAGMSCAALSQFTPAWVSCLGSSYPPSTLYEQTATIFAVKPNGDGGTRLNLKGRVNFSTLGTAPGHILTLSDSNFQKTVATANNRPTNDANDAYVGYDQGDGNPANIGISLGAPKSISNYIGNVGDGTNWLERLTSAGKTFKTNVTVQGNLTVTGTCTGCGGSSNSVTGDLTVTGKVVADSFQSTGTGPWSVEGSYGTLTAAAANKSKLGFNNNGKLAVSENAGAVTEVAKKTAQEFTYTFFDPNNPLTMSLQVPSIYVNRAAALHITEVYCEIDAGSATINLQVGGANVMSSDLACSTSGVTASTFASGKDAIAVGQKINHVTVAAGAGLHRMNVVVKYVVD